MYLTNSEAINNIRFVWVIRIAGKFVPSADCDSKRNVLLTLSSKVDRYFCRVEIYKKNFQTDTN